MRLRSSVLASATAVAACAAVPAVASAHPNTNHGLTIHATPSHVIAGAPVLIHGHLSLPHDANRVITLYHRVGLARTFTVIGRTTTNAQGKYYFPRAENVVETNRSWFVRGPGHTHSMTIQEKVAPELTLTASAAEATTRHPLTFTGTVSPGDAGGRVLLEVQSDVNDTWHTAASARIGADGNYVIRNAWLTPGPRTVRAFFVGSRLNAPAASDTTSIIVNQHESPYFTIQSSAPIVASGSPAVISGNLNYSHTANGDSGVPVELYERAPSAGTAFAPVQEATTGPAGGYRFTVSSTTDELYQVRVIADPSRATSQLFEGVQDQVTLNPIPSTSMVDDTIDFTGSVAPDSAGHTVLLEYLGRDDAWQVAATSTVLPNSTYSIPWTFGFPGVKQFRVRFAGGPETVGGVSAPQTITVAQATLASLPNN